jgi:hypothetical protein
MPSANPDGRGKTAPETRAFIEKCRAFLPRCFEVLEDLVEQKKYPILRLKAAEIILDRALGKPSQAVSVDGQAGDVLAVLHARLLDAAARHPALARTLPTGVTLLPPLDAAPAAIHPAGDDCDLV